MNIGLKFSSFQLSGEENEDTTTTSITILEVEGINCRCMREKGQSHLERFRMNMDNRIDWAIRWGMEERETKRYQESRV